MDASSGPVFLIEAAANLELDGVTSRKPLAASAVLRLTQTPGAIVRTSRAFPGTGVFLSAGSGELKTFHLDGNILDNAKTRTEER